MVDYIWCELVVPFAGLAGLLVWFISCWYCRRLSSVISRRVLAIVKHSPVNF